MSLHTAGVLLNFHPHVHSLVLPGVITPSGEYQELPEVDTELLCFHTGKSQPMIHATIWPIVAYAYVYALPAIGIIDANSA